MLLPLKNRCQGAPVSPVSVTRVLGQARVARDGSECGLTRHKLPENSTGLFGWTFVFLSPSAIVTESAGHVQPKTILPLPQWPRGARRLASPRGGLKAGCTRLICAEPALLRPCEHAPRALQAAFCIGLSGPRSTIPAGPTRQCAVLLKSSLKVTHVSLPPWS